jgi:hypothetical protein
MYMLILDYPNWIQPAIAHALIIMPPLVKTGFQKS